MAGERDFYYCSSCSSHNPPPALSGAKVEVLHLILVGVDVPQEAGEAPTIPGLTKDG